MLFYLNTKAQQIVSCFFHSEREREREREKERERESE